VAEAQAVVLVVGEVLGKVLEKALAKALALARGQEMVEVVVEDTHQWNSRSGMLPRFL
jgi:TctA family transporter